MLVSLAIRAASAHEIYVFRGGFWNEIFVIIFFESVLLEFSSIRCCASFCASPFGTLIFYCIFLHNIFAFLFSAAFAEFRENYLLCVQSALKANQVDWTETCETVNLAKRFSVPFSRAEDPADEHDKITKCTFTYTLARPGIIYVNVVFMPTTNYTRNYHLSLTTWITELSYNFKTAALNRQITEIQAKHTKSHIKRSDKSLAIM